MKKTLSGLWVAALVVLVPHIAGADTIWFGGAKAGVNWSTVTGSDIGDAPGYRSQIVAGGFAAVEMHRYFAIRLEGFFYPKGAEIATQASVPSDSGQPNYVQVNGTLSLSYFEFPLLLVGQLPVGEKVLFEAFGGAYYAYNLQTSFDVAAGGTTVYTGIEDEIKNSDTGIVLGLGVAWDTEHFRTHLEGRFEYSLASIDEQDFDVRNQTFAIVIGFTPIRHGD